MMHRATLPLLLAVCLPTPAQDPIPILLVSGANNHDWQWTTPQLERVLTGSGRFAVTVTTNPSVDLADAAGLANYAAVLLDYNGPRWGEAAEANFLAAVRGGTGVAIVHAADNAFPGWTEWETLCGDLWRQGTSHGRFHPFDVTIAFRDHAVTSTLPDLRAHPDELYHNLWRAPGANHRTLASALSSTASGGSGELEPMILVGSFGNGRVFHTPLGHVWRDNEATHASHLDPQFQTLVLRGVEWAATGRVTDGLERPNHLSAQQAAQGWRLLFDGAGTEGWRGWNKSEFPAEGWEVLNGCLRHTAGGGDLITVDTFTDFELAFEWKVARAVNSGVKYRVPEVKGYTAGPEYQILDDPGTRESHDPLVGAGALYQLFAPTGKRLAPTGSFNHSRIVARGGQLEHWLNGVKLLEADLDSQAWIDAKARSKFADMPNYGKGPGHVLLQDHGGEVWYRSIRLRELHDRPSTSLLSGPGLEGWTVLGDAEYIREGNDIVGSVPAGGLARNSFLRTERSFTDFVFETELKVEVPGNSGIQFRSAQGEENGRRFIFGYQAEIDCSKRRWSGGIYGERFGEWLADLKNDPAGKAAFRLDQWNHYRIEAIGDHLRVWVNGVLTADLIDGRAPEGIIALQVHGGGQGSFRWRNPRIREL
jgi:type 1 glutamine amidotransferase